VLIEGWNVGWDGEWFGNGSDFSFTKAYPDFDYVHIGELGDATDALFAPLAEDCSRPAEQVGLYRDGRPACPP